MAETRDGNPTVGWKLGDPPPGYYRLQLTCEFCGAHNGFIWPDSSAFALGVKIEAPPGSSDFGICRRCGKSDQCVVTSVPKRPPPKPPEPWSY